MLKAFLKRKLRRFGAAEQDHDEATSEADDVTCFEDALTSAVFERLAYLDPAAVWAILVECSSVLHGRALPIAPPAHAPEWSFWPRLGVGALGRNVRSVEPDVVVTWGDVVLGIEAKHHGGQSAQQWVEELHALRCSYPGRPLWLIAVGGLGPSDGRRLAEEATAALGADPPSILGLPWEKLSQAARARSRCHASPGVAACFGDIAAALNAWGYRERIWFDSLPESAGA